MNCQDEEKNKGKKEQSVLYSNAARQREPAGYSNDGKKGQIKTDWRRAHTQQMLTSPRK